MLNVAFRVNCLLQNKYNGCAGMVDRLRLGRRGVSHISSSLIVHIIYDCLLSTLPKKNYKYIRPLVYKYRLWLYIYIYTVPTTDVIYVHPSPCSSTVYKKKIIFFLFLIIRLLYMIIS